MLDNPSVVTKIQERLGKESIGTCCKRSERNLYYLAHVMTVLHKMEKLPEDRQKVVAEFWLNRIKNSYQGSKVVLYEIGKADNTAFIMVLLTRAYEELKKGTCKMIQLKRFITAARKGLQQVKSQQSDNATK